MASEVAKSNVCKDIQADIHESGPVVYEISADKIDHTILQGSGSSGGLKNCLCCGLRCIPDDVPNTYCLECEDMIDEAQVGCP